MCNRKENIPDTFLQTLAEEMWADYIKKFNERNRNVDKLQIKVHLSAKKCEEKNVMEM